MNTVLLIAKGKKYTDILFRDYHLIADKAKLVVYTDNTNKVKERLTNLDVREYTESTFRYFDKYTLAYKLSQEIKKPVLYCDVGRLDVNAYVNFFNFDSTKIDSIFTNSNWQGVYSSKDLINLNSPYFEKGYWNNIVEYFENTGISPSKVVPYLERLFIFPYESWVSNVIHEVENIRELFENNSRNKTHVYPGIGNGEGLALGYALSKTKSKHKFLRDIPILTKQPYTII